jgi:hypothetical protein
MVMMILESTHGGESWYEGEDKELRRLKGFEVEKLP